MKEKRRRHREHTVGKGHVKTEAEIRVMHLQSKEC